MYTCYFNRVLNRCDVILQLKTMLKNIGWVVLSSSDGTTYNASGDQITQSGSGAGGMNNTNAWFRIQCPLMGGVNRELTLQRTNIDQNWRIKYSYSSGFVGGVPGITRTPSATDEGLILGTGSDASPIGGSFFSSSTIKYNLFIIGDANEGYSFFTHAGDTSGINCYTFYFDKINDTNGSLSSGNVDGYIFYTRSIPYSNNSPSSFYGSAWYRKGLLGEAFLNWSLGTYIGPNTANNDLQGYLGCNAAAANRENFLPIQYSRPKTTFASQNGLLGYSSMILYKSSNRYNYSSFNYNNTNNNKICISDFILPWDGTFPKFP